MLLAGLADRRRHGRASTALGITLGGIPPFIMTLGMMVMGRGLAMTISGGHPIHFREEAASFAWLGQGHFLHLPVPVWIFAAGRRGGLFRAPLHRRSAATSMPSAATRRPRGFRASTSAARSSPSTPSPASSPALTALIFVSRLTVGEPVAGTGLELEAIAITVIGGTSLFGGEGSVIGTIIGAAIIAVLANILNLFGVSPFTQQIVKGAIIVAAVLFEMQRRRRSSSAI